MFFSILIPVYNASKYIDECIASVINQTETDFEIVLVDDGSKDDSVSICKKWLEQYPNVIRIIEKENTGSLLTRRRCLKEARGDYFYMIDADDYIVDRDALKKIKSAIEKTNCDLLFFNATSNEIERTKLYPYSFADGQIFEGESLGEIYNLILETKYMNTLWNKVFYRDLVDWDANYEEHKRISVGTDFFQGCPIMSNASKILFIDEVFYYYRTTEGSIVHSFNQNFTYSLKEGHLKLIECTKKWKYSISDIERKLANRYMLTSSTIAFKGRLIKERKKIFEHVKSIGDDELFVESYHRADLKNLNLYRKIIVKLMVSKCYWIFTFLLPLFKKYGM